MTLNTKETYDHFLWYIYIHEILKNNIKLKDKYNKAPLFSKRIYKGVVCNKQYCK